MLSEQIRCLLALLLLTSPLLPEDCEIILLVVWHSNRITGENGKLNHSKQEINYTNVIKSFLWQVQKLIISKDLYIIEELQQPKGRPSEAPY